MLTQQLNEKQVNDILDYISSPQYTPTAFKESYSPEMFNENDKIRIGNALYQRAIELRTTSQNAMSWAFVNLGIKQHKWYNFF